MLNSEIKPKDYNYNYKEIILEIYNNSYHSNFKSFFKNIKHRRTIIYTFSKITDDIFKDNMEKDNQKIKNIFGIFYESSTVTEMIDSIKSESDIGFVLKSFTESENKLLILRFSEKDLNKVCIVHYVINNYEIDYPKLKEKIIILIVHKQRMLKMDNIKREELELISLFDDEYYQIFIDNLHGKENLKISQLL